MREQIQKAKDSLQPGVRIRWELRMPHRYGPTRIKEIEDVLRQDFGVICRSRHYMDYEPNSPLQFSYSYEDENNPEKPGVFSAGCITFHEKIHLQADRIANCQDCGSAVCDLHQYCKDIQRAFDSAIAEAPMDTVLKRSHIRKRMYNGFIEAKYGKKEPNKYVAVGKCIVDAIYWMAPNPNGESYDGLSLADEE